MPLFLPPFLLIEMRIGVTHSDSMTGERRPPPNIASISSSTLSRSLGLRREVHLPTGSASDWSFVPDSCSPFISARLSEASPAPTYYSVGCGRGRIGQLARNCLSMDLLVIRPTWLGKAVSRRGWPQLCETYCSCSPRIGQPAVEVPKEVLLV